ncbi:MAG: hypothetical protein WCS37_12410 [Chloroflexota bacterium]|nr:hypothetical protein [Chloroflexota bacterium]
MNLSQMVYEMAHNVLSSADIKAICKNRGFSDKELNSRFLFEHTFLSPTGLEVVMSKLTAAEIATLHLLYMDNQTVDVSFFSRLYSTAGTRCYGTFTQQYKPVYDSVQANLVRKGLLVITEAKTNALGKTKMELWCFHFPSEFGQYLPPLLTPSIRTPEVGTVKADIFRNLLLERIETQVQHYLRLVEGSIYTGPKKFSAKDVPEWQQSTWQANIKSVEVSTVSSKVFQGYVSSENQYSSPNPLPFVLYAFSQLKTEEWVTSEQLNTLLDVFYNTTSHPVPTQLCAAGYDTGCLAGYFSNGKVYYRLPDSRHIPQNLAPEDYLKILSDGRIMLILAKVPYEVLEILNQGTYLALDKGQLKIIPSLSKLMELSEAAREDPAMNYLKTHSAAFQALFEKLENQWGKLIIHENLLVARITDLSLRVQIKKAFGSMEENQSGRVAFLLEEYIAFPRTMLGDIEKLVKKSGHIIKTVQAK